MLLWSPASRHTNILRTLDPSKDEKRNAYLAQENVFRFLALPLHYRLLPEPPIRKARAAQSANPEPQLTDFPLIQHLNHKQMSCLQMSKTHHSPSLNRSMKPQIKIPKPYTRKRRALNGLDCYATIVFLQRKRNKLFQNKKAKTYLNLCLDLYIYVYV